MSILKNAIQRSALNPVKAFICGARRKRELNRGRAFEGFHLRIIVITAVATIVALTETIIFISTIHGSRITSPIDATKLNDSNEAIAHAHQNSVATQSSSKHDPTGILFDLKRVLEQSPETVSQVLRESPVLWPDRDTIPGTLRGKYKGGKIEIAYVDEGARLITIYFSRCKLSKPAGAKSSRCLASDDFTNYKYQQDIPGFLQAIGLPKTERPSVNNMTVLRWNGASGIYEVSVFPNGLGGISYIHAVSSRYYACFLERTESECKSD